MSTQLLSLSWKDHSSSLVTVCKTLLDSSFLVDCTIAAEGHSLKAHRLILSACSPYFHMLFNEINEMHPIVILNDVPFDAVKAVVNFVYHGETQIPERHLGAFMALAESLQIKGLNNTPINDGKKCYSWNAEGNVPQCPSSDNQDHCEVQGTSASHRDSPENPSRQHLHLSGGNTDVVPAISSVSFEGCSVSCDDMQSASVIMPLREQQIHPVCDEPSIDTQISVKCEPLCSELLETNHDRFNYLERNKPMTGNFVNCIVDEGSATTFSEQDLNQYSSSNDASHGYVQAALVMPPLQQQHHQQQVTQLLEVATSGPDLADPHEPMCPVLLVPKQEQMNDEENEEHMIDVCDNDMNEVDEETEPGEETLPGEHMPIKSSTFVQMEMGPWPSGSLGAYGEGAEPMAVHVSPPSQPGALPSQLEVLAHKHSGEGPYKCGVCGGAFADPKTLQRHEQRHVAKRMYRCGVCGDSFMRMEHLTTHSCEPTNKRKFSCDECHVSFKRKEHLTKHARLHTGERPFRCEECGASFTQSFHLARHRRTHTGERPHRCDACGEAFAKAHHLRRHTRELCHEPHRCEVCGRPSPRPCRSRTHPHGRAAAPLRGVRRHLQQPAETLAPHEQAPGREAVSLRRVPRRLRLTQHALAPQADDTLRAAAVARRGLFAPLPPPRQEHLKDFFFRFGPTRTTGRASLRENS